MLVYSLLLFFPTLGNLTQVIFSFKSQPGNTKEKQHSVTIALRTGRHFGLLFVVHKGLPIIGRHKTSSQRFHIMTENVLALVQVLLSLFNDSQLSELNIVLFLLFIDATNT